ncbi:MAG: hypothetical protein ACJ754_29225 [Pyrinomonadaceae bacterium]
MRRSLFVPIIGVIFLAAAGAPSSAQTAAPKNEVEFNGIYTIPGGEVNLSGSTAAGTTISFENDFGLKNKLGFGLRYIRRAESGKHKFMLNYARTASSNTRALSRTIVFRDRTYAANLDTRAEESLGVFLATYAYRWGNQKVRIGPMAQLGFATARVDLSAVTNTADTERSGSITKLVGTVGYDMDIHPTDRVSIYNNVGVFRLKRDRVLRGEVGLKYYLTRAFGVNGGYQFGRYKLVDDPNFIRANEHGPLFGAVLRF